MLLLKRGSSERRIIQVEKCILKKNVVFFHIKATPCWSGRRKFQAQFFAPLFYLLLCMSYSTWYSRGFTWLGCCGGIYRVVQANDGLGMHSETKILLQFLVGLVLLLFRFHMEEKRSFFLKIQFSTRIILHLDKPLSNNWTMPLSDAWYYADDKVLDIF